MSSLNLPALGMHLVRVDVNDAGMLTKLGVGLALMGLSVPGRILPRVVGPVAFVVGLELVAWALVAHPFLPYAAGLITVVALLIILLERRQAAKQRAARLAHRPQVS